MLAATGGPDTKASTMASSQPPKPPAGGGESAEKLIKEGLEAGKTYFSKDEGAAFRKAHARHSRSFMRLYGLGFGGLVICAGVAYALGQMGAVKKSNSK